MTSRFLGVIVAAALFAPAGPASAFCQSAELDAAIEDHRYDEALTRVRQLADAGVPDCQRAAGLMLRYGERLYGSEVHADPEQARRYLEMAARQGDAFAVRLMARRE